jgi:hypothetical protein
MRGVVGFGSKAKKGFIFLLLCLFQRRNYVGDSYASFVSYMDFYPRLNHAMKIFHTTAPLNKIAIEKLGKHTSSL